MKFSGKYKIDIGVYDFTKEVSRMYFELETPNPSEESLTLVANRHSYTAGLKELNRSLQSAQYGQYSIDLEAEGVPIKVE